MNPNEEESKADTLRENTQVAQYEAQESARLQKNKLKKLADFKKNKGGPVDPQLTLSTFGLMFGVAIFFDVISFGMNFIPFIGGLLQDITVTPIAIMTFFICLKMHGISFTKGTRGFSLLLTVVIGFIPIINALPEWSVYIGGLYLSQTKISTSMQKSLKKVQGK